LILLGFAVAAYLEVYQGKFPIQGLDRSSKGAVFAQATLSAFQIVGYLWCPVVVVVYGGWICYDLGRQAVQWVRELPRYKQ
jgi:hypothetical protein